MLYPLSYSPSPWIIAHIARIFQLLNNTCGKASHRNDDWPSLYGCFVNYLCCSLAARYGADEGTSVSK